MKLVDINGIEVSLNDPPRVAFSEPETAGIRIYGDQNQRFLSAEPLGISGKPLKAKDFPEAIKEAQDVVRAEYGKMRLSVETFLEEEKPAVPLKQFLKLTGPAMIVRVFEEDEEGPIFSGKAAKIKDYPQLWERSVKFFLPWRNGGGSLAVHVWIY